MANNSPIEDADLVIEQTEVVGIGAPPGTGKTVIGPMVASLLSEATGKKWIFWDNEWGFTPEMRVECSVRSGLALDTPEFARAFNRLGQIAFQAAIVKLASQGVNVVFVGPFEDLTAKIGDKNVLEVLQAQFAAFAFRFHYLLLWPDEATADEISDPKIMADVESEIRRRLEERGAEGSIQRHLDGPKIANPRYYQERALKVINSAKQLNLGITRASIGQRPDSIANEIVTALLAQRATVSE